MPNFVLTQRADGYRWVCPTCGYDQERAYVLRAPRSGQQPAPVPMRAGMRCEGLLGPVIGPQCLNCLGRKDEEAAVRLAQAAREDDAPAARSVPEWQLRAWAQRHMVQDWEPYTRIAPTGTWD